MIIGTIVICDQMATILFDLDFIYSYVSISFALGLGAICDALDTTIHFSTPVGELL